MKIIQYILIACLLTGVTKAIAQRTSYEAGFIKELFTVHNSEHIGLTTMGNGFNLGISRFKNTKQQIRFNLRYLTKTSEDETGVKGRSDWKLEEFKQTGISFQVSKSTILGAKEMDYASYFYRIWGFRLESYIESIELTEPRSYEIAYRDFPLDLHIVFGLGYQHRVSRYVSLYAEVTPWIGIYGEAGGNFDIGLRYKPDFTKAR